MRTAAKRVEDLLVNTDPEWEVEPYGDLILAVHEADDRTAGGLHIPEKARQGHMPRFRVLAVGEGHRTQNGEVVPLKVKAGDLVMLAFDRSQVYEVPGRGKRILVNDSAILARVKDAGELQ